MPVCNCQDISNTLCFPSPDPLLPMAFAPSAPSHPGEMCEHAKSAQSRLITINCVYIIAVVITAAAAPVPAPGHRYII